MLKLNRVGSGRITNLLYLFKNSAQPEPSGLNRIHQHRWTSPFSDASQWLYGGGWNATHSRKLGYKRVYIRAITDPTWNAHHTHCTASSLPMVLLSTAAFSERHNGYTAASASASDHRFPKPSSSSVFSPLSHQETQRRWAIEDLTDWTRTTNSKTSRLTTTNQETRHWLRFWLVWFWF